MRVSVDVNDDQIDALDALAKRVRRSRAALIRAAIDDYLDRYRREQIQESFGLWGQRRIDDLTYQEKVRHEWAPFDNEQVRRSAERLPETRKDRKFREPVLAPTDSSLKSYSQALDAVIGNTPLSPRSTLRDC